MARLHRLPGGLGALFPGAVRGGGDGVEGLVTGGVLRGCQLAQVLFLGAWPRPGVFLRD